MRRCVAQPSVPQISNDNTYGPAGDLRTTGMPGRAPNGVSETMSRVADQVTPSVVRRATSFWLCALSVSSE